MTASAAANTGGLSKMTTSAIPIRVSTRARNLRELSSSPGLGGVEPAVKTDRPGITSWGASGARPSRTSVRPGVGAISRSLWREGRRRSVSTSSTFLPSIAMAKARFAAVVLLPSPGQAEVTSRVRAGASTVAKWMFVRRTR